MDNPQDLDLCGYLTLCGQKFSYVQTIQNITLSERVPSVKLLIMDQIYHSLQASAIIKALSASITFLFALTFWLVGIFFGQ